MADGDRLTVLQDQVEAAFALYGIEASERGQPSFGARAKAYMADLAFGTPVRLEPPDVGSRPPLIRVRPRIGDSGGRVARRRPQPLTPSPA